MSLSRYQRKWFLTYPRAYGMAAYPGQRIVYSLNRPEYSEKESEDHARRFFWLNPTSETHPYTPNETTPTTNMSSPIHIILDSNTPVAKLTGRMKVQPSNFGPDNKSERACYEVEIIMPEEGLLRQCYYCLDWEYESMKPWHRFKACGDDTYWCQACEKGGSISSSISSVYQTLSRDVVVPLIQKGVPQRDSIYRS